MAVQTDMVDKVRQYAAEASRFEVRTVHQTSTVGRAQYELKLDEVLGTLRQQVKEQKSAVENVRVTLHIWTSLTYLVQSCEHRSHRLRTYSPLQTLNNVFRRFTAS